MEKACLLEGHIVRVESMGVGGSVADVQDSQGYADEHVILGGWGNSIAMRRTSETARAQV